MIPLKRASLFLSLISAWFFVSAIVSLILVSTLYISDLPSHFNNLSEDIKRIQDLVTLENVCVAALNYAGSQKDFSWILVKWAFSFVAIWTAIFTTALIYLRRQLKTFKQTEHTKRVESSLDLAVDGKLPLWKAFWGVFIGLSYGLSITIFVLMYSLKHFHIIDSAKVSDLIITPLAYSLILVIYLFTADIAWRSSRNSTNNIWHYLSRAVILLLIVIPLIKAIFILYHFHIISF